MYSRDEEERLGKLKVALTSNRVYIRKAQYSFGWDWGPILTTSGIWKDVRLEEVPEIEITNVIFNTISMNEVEANVEVKPIIIKETGIEYSIAVSLFYDDKEVCRSVLNSDNAESIKLKVHAPKLWFPNGEGEQNIYNLVLKILNVDQQVIQKIERNVGIRKIELVKQTRNQPDFAFAINGKRIYAKGVNWIPSDSFLSRISEKKYFELLLRAKDARMNIVRVWGGGIYEQNVFYELCDKLGLLVWQDFMFACAAYPEHDQFLENITEEIEQNVSRIQYHPSIALWCGNNENEWLWYGEVGGPVSKMPGYKIYNALIPKLLKKIDPLANYWQSSPFGDDEDPNSYNSGNNHQWKIWSMWADYTEVIPRTG